MRNCHIADNYNSETTAQWWGKDGSTARLTSRITYCCTSPVNSIIGTGCVLDDKTKWTFDRKGRIKLLKGSPCIDAASQQSWMVGATDLYGRDRKLYGMADIGAVEYVKPMGFNVIVR